MDGHHRRHVYYSKHSRAYSTPYQRRGIYPKQTVKSVEEILDVSRLIIVCGASLTALMLSCASDLKKRRKVRWDIYVALLFPSIFLGYYAEEAQFLGHLFNIPPVMPDGDATLEMLRIGIPLAIYFKAGLR